MDPLTAVGLGANVIQFLEFVTKLVSVGREIGESTHGATVENADLEAVTRSIVWLNGRVVESKSQWQEKSRSRSAATSPAQGMAFLVSACDDVATQLLEVLDKLKAGNKHRAWKGIVQAFKTIWTKGQIDSLRNRLDQYRAAIQTTLILLLR